MKEKTYAKEMIANRIRNKEHIYPLIFQDINAYGDYSDYFDEAIYSESYSWEGDYSL